MADQTIRRFIRLILDRSAAKQAGQEMEKALAQAGQQGGQSFLRELRAQFDRRMAELREQLARGIIDEKEFRRRAAEAAREFNRGLLSHIERLRREGQLTDREFVKLTRSLKNVGGTGEREIGLIQLALEKVRAVALSVSGALASLFAIDRIRAFIFESARLAARYETAGVVLRRVGENAGYTAEQLDYVERALRKTGISMLRSREVAASLIAANIDLARATNLARIAQDAAVIANTNSSEAFDRLVQGISSGNVEILRNLGLAVNFQQAYQRAARQLGKAASELTEYERVQARVNAVMEAGAGIAGTYEAALDTAGKQAGSAVRLFEDLRIKLGQVFLPVYRDAVFRYADALKRLNDALDQLAESDIETWGRRVAAVIDTLVWVVHQLARKVNDLVMRFVGLAIAIRGLVHGGLSILQRMLAGVADGFALFLDAAAKIEEFFSGREGAQRAREQAEAIREWAAAVRDAAAVSSEAARTAFRELAAPPRGRRSGATVGERSVSLDRPAPPVDPEEEWRARMAAFAAEINLLERGHRLRTLQFADIERAYAIEQRLMEQLRRGNLALEDRVALEEQLARLRRVLRIEVPLDIAGTAQAEIRAGFLPIAAEPLTEADLGIDAIAEAWLETNEQMVVTAQNAALGIAGAFQDAFSVLLEDMSDLGAAAEALGRGIGGALLGGLAQYASGKVAENVAAAIENVARGMSALAIGNAPSAAAYFDAAKTHTLAALKWSVLAGMSGAAQSAVAGGGRGGLSGGVPTGATDVGGRLIERERRGPEVHIYIDPLDPANPAYQRNVAAASQLARERYGEGAVVHVHPRTRR